VPSCYEIIVVDNASTDETPQVVRTFQGEYREHTIVRIYEPQQGLGYARNAGLNHAHGRYVAYLDDDARASTNWLKTALELFEIVKPTPICLGGHILPLYDVPKPKWFKDDYEIRTWGGNPRFLHRGEPFSGSNMVWRKEILEAFEGFDVRVGVKGGYLSIGEETVLFNKVWRSFDHPVFYYSPQLSVHHWVPPFKMTVSYQLKRAFVAGQVWSQLHCPKAFHRRLRFLARNLFAIAKIGSLAVARRNAYRRWENWLVEEWRPVASKVGVLMGAFGLVIPIRQG
jgi:glycosyltransferase involved in cell wall biosynthesis